MKKVFLALCTTVLLVVTTQTKAQQYPEEKLGWKLGSQAWTFNKFTFFETVDKIKSCNLKYVEAFPGQKLGGVLKAKWIFICRLKNVNRSWQS